MTDCAVNDVEADSVDFQICNASRAINFHLMSACMQALASGSESDIQVGRISTVGIAFVQSCGETR